MRRSVLLALAVVASGSLACTALLGDGFSDGDDGPSARAPSGADAGADGPSPMLSVADPTREAGSGAAATDCTETSTLGPFRPRRIRSSASGGQPWRDPEKAVYGNDFGATAAIDDGQRTEELLFDQFVVADERAKRVRGIRVWITRWSTSGNAWDVAVRLMVDGRPLGEPRVSPSRWSLLRRGDAYGAADDLWGTSGDILELGQSGFGVGVTARSSANGEIVTIDDIYMEVVFCH